MKDRTRRGFRWLALALGTLAVCVQAQAVDVPEPVLQAERQRIEAMANAMQSAIAVFANGGSGGGSGVVISSDGYALTNFHVVKPAGVYMQCAMADDRLYDAVLVGLDPTGDVALIKLLGREDFVPAELGDSDTMRVGDWCFAIGNPFLLATDFQPTVSFGLVSGTHRYQPPAGTLLEYADCLQTDAAINPGNSGGPLFDGQGRLIGINGRCSFEKRGRVNVGVGYAISINQIKKFIGYLRSGRIVDHATLGATVAANDQGQIVVSNILDSSDAYRRGLRFGDQIVSFGGRPVTTVNGFKNVLGIYPKGWRVPLSYAREGQQTDVLVRLAAVHTRDDLIRKVQGSPQGGPPDPQRKPGRQKTPPQDQEPDSESPDASVPPTTAEEGPPKAKLQEPRKIEPKPGRPIPHPGRPQAAPPPEHVAKFIEKRSGYANYYFNRLNVDRVWNDFAQHGSFAATGPRWVLAGKVNGSAPFQFTLGAKEVTAELPARRERIDLAVDLDRHLVPAGTGGLLPALHVWQELLRLGPQKFGEVYYLGTTPLVDHEGLYDILVGTYRVVEARFAFEPATGHLVGMELFPDSNSDPCELYFDDYREVDGRQWPHRIQVRYGLNIVLELQIDTITTSEDDTDHA